MMSNYGKGVTFILFATFFLALMDGLSRHLAQNYNVFVINMIRSWFFAFIVIALAFRKKGGLYRVLSTPQPLLQITRGILLITAICSGVYSFTKLGLVLTLSWHVTHLLSLPFLGRCLMKKLAYQNGLRFLLVFWAFW